jgi:hypothetical protein
LVSAGNVPGLVIYLLVRPQQTLEEGQNKELFYASVIDKKISACDECGCLVRSDYKFCPNCAHHLALECPHCHRRINPTWKYCTYCDTQLIPDTFFVELKKNIAILMEQIWELFVEVVLLSLKFVLFAIYTVYNAFTSVLTFISKQLNKIAFVQEVNKARLEIKMQLPEIGLLKRYSNVKFIPERKHVHEKKLIVQTPTKKRGRPKGSVDSQPRKKRGDAGKRRGRYKKS